MEKEYIQELGAMFGCQIPLGHLADGARWPISKLCGYLAVVHTGKCISGSEQGYYSHSRISGVLGISYFSVLVGNDGRMDLDAVEQLLQQGDVGTVVVTMGNTGIGAVDPLSQILLLRRKYNFRIHADAAYGAYFRLAANLGSDNQ